MTDEHCAHQTKVVVENTPPAPVMPHESNNNAAALKIVQDFKAVVNDAESLDQAAKYLLKELVDDAIFAVALELHQLRKTGNLTALDGLPEDAAHAESTVIAAEANALGGSSGALAASPNAFSLAAVTGSGSPAPAVGGPPAASGASASLRKVDSQNYDIFGVSTAKKPMECNCPNCERLVSASRFAPHLEKCMGMGRLSSRIASRRLATKDVNSGSNSLGSIGGTTAGGYAGGNAFLAGSSPYLQLQGAAMTDDEDDVDWSSTEKRRKRSNSTRNNKNNEKKNNGKTSF